MSIEKDTSKSKVPPSEKSDSGYDYDHVNSIARIALYDDLLSAPRVTEIMPAPTGEFIDTLSTSVYEQAKSSGGTIPYTVIREVSENFIHARFNEATVSILNGGNTIRFSDQGPGIACKERVKLPGFSSAIEPMKRYIRGVGSGLPIVKEYLDFTGGTISIEDNLGTGSVVTISANREDGEEECGQEDIEYPLTESDHIEMPPYQQQTFQQAPVRQQVYPGVQVVQNPYANVSAQGAPANQVPIQTYQQPMAIGNPAVQGQAYYAGTMQQQPTYVAGVQEKQFDSPVAGSAQNATIVPVINGLTSREKDVLKLFRNEGMLGVTEIHQLAGIPQSSASVTLTKLEQSGLLVKTAGKKRILTDIGAQVANLL